MLSFLLLLLLVLLLSLTLFLSTIVHNNKTVLIFCCQYDHDDEVDEKYSYYIRVNFR